MRRVDRFGFKGIAGKTDINTIEQEAKMDSCPATTYEALLQSQKDNPAETALSFFMLGNEFKRPFEFSYTDLIQNVNSCANALHQLGIRKGDVVAIILPNLPETCFAMVAAQTVGISFPINPLLESEMLKELLIESRAKVLITIGSFVKTDIWEKVDTIRHQIGGLEHIIQVDMSVYLRGFKKLVVRSLCAVKKKGESTENQQVHSYESVINSVTGDSLNFTFTAKPEDPAAYFHTGGTTGRPKIAVQTQENICFDCWSTGHNLNTANEDLNVYGGLPLFHVFGAMVMLSMCWAGSGHLVMVGPKGFRGVGVLKNFWQTLEFYKINVLAAVPTIYGMLADEESPLIRDIQLKFAISGAAPMPLEVMKKFKSIAGIDILEGYGCTEGTCMVAVNPPYGECKPGSVGFPIPFTKVKILKPNQEKGWEECETDEIGAVCLSGKHVFKGYLNDGDNQSIWIDFKSDRFYNTGDLGKMDSEGYLWLTGRSKELIIRGGHNIDPLSIEAPFYEHAAVELAAAVGRPDERVGELPVVYVQLRSGASATAPELQAFVQHRIHEQSAMPKEIILIDTMPVTTIGKIYKPELCMMEIRKACQKALEDRKEVLSIDVVNSKETGFTVCIKVNAGESIEGIERVLSSYSFANKIFA